jgi:hypothetical protein
MSLPEVLLVLREDGRRQAGKAIMALQTQALAAFAVWDKEAGRRLERLRRSLENSIGLSKPADGEGLDKIFRSWGVESD